MGDGGVERSPKEAFAQKPQQLGARDREKKRKRLSLKMEAALAVSSFHRSDLARDTSHLRTSAASTTDYTCTIARPIPRLRASQLLMRC